MEVIGRKIVIDGVDVAITNQGELKNAIKKTNEALNDVQFGSKAYKELNSQLTFLKANQKETRRENRQLEKQLVASGQVTTGAYRKLSVQLSVLKGQYKDLVASGKGQTDAAKSLLDQIGKIDTRLKSIDSSVGENFRNVGNYKSALGGIKASIKGLVGWAAAARAVKEVMSEVIVGGYRLAQQAKGIEIAFQQVAGGAKALEDVRDSTNGLLSDLDIKKAIVEFDEFNISQKNTAKFFKFLAVQSLKFGKSVDKLKDSLVEGLSKESKQRIDNLGISTVDLNAELEKTPDFVEAVANVIDEKLKESGEIVDYAASSTERFKASWDNFRLSIGQGIQKDNFLSGIIDQMSVVLNRAAKVTSVLGISKGLDDAFLSINPLTKSFYKDKYKNEADVISGLENKIKSYASTVKSVESQNLVEKLAKAYQKILNQDEIKALAEANKLLEDQIKLNEKQAEQEKGKGSGSSKTGNREKKAITLRGMISALEKDIKGLAETYIQSGNADQGIVDNLTDKIDDLDNLNKKLNESEQLVNRLKIGDRGVTDVQSIDSLDLIPSSIGDGGSDKDRINELDEIGDERYSESLDKVKDQQRAETQEIASALEERRDMYASYVDQVGGILGNLLVGNREQQAESLKDLGKFLISQIEKTLTASIAEIYIKNVAQLGFLGIAKATLLTTLVKGAASGIKTKLLAADGISIDRNGMIQGKKHSQGGEIGLFNGRLVEAEQGEFFDYDEFGNALILNAKTARHYNPVLARIRGYSFAGKGQLLSDLNTRFGGVPLAEDGIKIRGTANQNLFNTIDSIESRKFYKDLGRQVYEGSRAGSMDGSRQGITEASEQTRRINELENKRTK